MNKEPKDDKPNSERKITRREMLTGAGILGATSTVDVAHEKAMIRGTVKYPWGIVRGAKVVTMEDYKITDSEGNYEIMMVGPGKCTVTVQAPFPGYEAQSQVVTLASGETKTVDFYLDFEKAVVHGHVYNEDGEAIAGAILSGVRSGKDMETTVTDEKGYFKFDGASPGNLFVRVNATGYMGQIQDFVARKEEKTELEIHLTRGTCKVHGTVTDKKGHPLQGELRLQLMSALILMTTESKADSGYYELSVLPGTYDIVVDVSGYQADIWRGTISADTNVNFQLASLSESQTVHDPSILY